MKLVIILFTLAGSLLAAGKLLIPIDPDLQKQFVEELKSAAQDGNYSTVLVYARRSLELYPNDRLVQASIYLVMSEAAQKTGDTADSPTFASIANILDPTLAARVAKQQDSGPQTRGDRPDKFHAAMAIFTQGMQQRYQQIRTQVQHPGQQRGANVQYPAAPVGDPNYRANPAMNTPMPGWTQGQPYYAASPAPYAAPGYTPPTGVTRGGKAPVFKVVHDHSVTGDSAYFEHSCGALVSISGSNLTFTAAGGEAPRVIPAGDIREIRMNTAIGRDQGLFHIATRQGLYLSLALESANRDDARAAVAELRAKLSLGE